MPELPEVETVAAGLRPLLTGLRVAEAKVYLPKLLRATTAADLRDLAGDRLGAVRRRGKVLIIEGGRRTLLFHLKMTGQFLFVGPEVPRDKHVHFVLTFENAAEELRFRDVRKFGFLRCVPTGQADDCEEVRRLGPEPLEVPRAEFEARLAGRKGRLKSLLLDQTFLAGVGNIYADEALFAARIHPLTPAGRLGPRERRRLWVELRRILRRAVAAGGSSIRDYRGVDGTPGDFQTRHRVYGRAGEPCVRCRTAVRRTVVGGRATFYCPACQRRQGRF